MLPFCCSLVDGDTSISVTLLESHLLTVTTLQDFSIILSTKPLGGAEAGVGPTYLHVSLFERVSDKLIIILS